MQDPYRPQAPMIDPELARLAAQGGQVRHQVVSQQRAYGTGHLTVAIGAYRGSTTKKVILGSMLGCAGLGVLLLLLGVLTDVLDPHLSGVVVGPCFMLAFFGIFAMAFIPPSASASAIRAEEAWSQNQPFRLDGYFDVLAGEPMPIRAITYHLEWQPGVRPPDPLFLQNVISAIDPNARVLGVDAGGAQVMSGGISGSTGIRVNGRHIFRNHRMCESVHRMVEGALWPLSRSFPMGRVGLRG